MTAVEINFDGLVGPTHHYGGLGRGNVASQRSERDVSNPKAAALQGLRKMKTLHELGVLQAVVPPHDRPAMTVLRRLGFHGRDAHVLRSVQRHDPALLAACASASSMWAANAATVCPSADSGDGKVHFTPANLNSHFHRSIEAPTTARALRAIFFDHEHFVHHAPLPSTALFGDEGAANHTRLCRAHGQLGTQLFVYGKRGSKPGVPPPRRFAPRHTLEASRAIARLHELDTRRVVFARQLSAAIDAGVFHSDVIAVGNENVFLCHEQAFADQEQLRQTLRSHTDTELRWVEVAAADVTLEEAVETYLFNSQLVTLTSGRMAWILPKECEETPRVWASIRKIQTEIPEIEKIVVVDVRQSMKNGGGPACLRLRVVLTKDELARMNRRVLFDEALFDSLLDWIGAHYRDRLRLDDLADPELLRESRTALDELTRILGMGSLYSFQR